MTTTRHHRLREARPAVHMRLQVKAKAKGRGQARAQTHNRGMASILRVESQVLLDQGLMDSRSHHNKGDMALRLLAHLGLVGLAGLAHLVDTRLPLRGGSKVRINSTAIGLSRRSYRSRLPSEEALLGDMI
jgi:hypothetical protein